MTFNPQNLCGWAGEEEAKKAWEQIGHLFPKYATPPTEVRRMMLFDIVRKVLGKDTPNYAQQVGDCVSFGAKNAIEYLSCIDILIRGDAEKFKPIFPPYLYGTGRVFIGKGQLGSGDGSLGSWQAKAVEEYGAINSDADGCPSYSGSLARKWGYRPGPPDQFVTIGKKHLVQSTVKVTEWDEAVKFICNGYPITIASNVGFEMGAGNDGFHDMSGSWGHQMCVVGIDDEHTTPYAIILNSWGDVHGRLKDFKSGEELPVGVLRVKKSALQRILSQDDSFAYSQWQGFPAQKLSRSDFNFGGD